MDHEEEFHNQPLPTGGVWDEFHGGYGYVTERWGNGWQYYK